MKPKLPRQLTDFYPDRKGPYVKAVSDEQFLKKLNETLAQAELESYRNYKIKYPLIFIFGPPRCGTTLMTQLIAHSFKIGYINNFAARFYRAPLHGLRLSEMILGNQKRTNYQSDYAHTEDPLDFHEFGYFWRYWLKKESISGVIHAADIEDEIDWSTLAMVLANIQHYFGKGLVFKNIFGSYHLRRMTREFQKVIYIYITRDLTDAAMSILGARRKYYNDLNTWWSYMPKEYDLIKNLDYMQQIAGQVYFLNKFYNQETQKLNNVISVKYSELAESPQSVLKQINCLSEQLYGHTFAIENKPPEYFRFSSYPDSAEKEQFRKLIKEFQKKDQRSSHD